MRCAMSRMRVSGVDTRNSPLKDGSRVCMRRAAMISFSAAALRPPPPRVASPMTHSSELRACGEARD